MLYRVAAIFRALSHQKDLSVILGLVAEDPAVRKKPPMALGRKSFIAKLGVIDLRECSSFIPMLSTLQWIEIDLEKFPFPLFIGGIFWGLVKGESH